MPSKESYAVEVSKENGIDDCGGMGSSSIITQESCSVVQQESKENEAESMEVPPPQSNGDHTSSRKLMLRRSSMVDRKKTYLNRVGEWNGAFGKQLEVGSPNIQGGIRTFGLLTGNEIVGATGIWCLSYMDPNIKNFNFAQDTNPNDPTTIDNHYNVTIYPNFHLSCVYATSRVFKQKEEKGGIYYEQVSSKLSSIMREKAVHALMHTRACAQRLAAIPHHTKMRVFYRSEEDRAFAVNVIRKVRDEMMGAVKYSRVVISLVNSLRKSSVSPDTKFARYVLKVWEMGDDEIKLVDYFAPKYFGIEIYERIFWEIGLARMRYMKSQFKSWASSFAQLDPRYRIYKYFNDAAQNGIDDGRNQQRSGGADGLPQLHAFNMASVFTVWRPTSMLAIKKMIEGTGVGKGMDITGKTAKLGRHSGYVPFMQVRPVDIEEVKCNFEKPEGTLVRIFFTTKEARDNAAKKLTAVRARMIKIVNGLPSLEDTKTWGSIYDNAMLDGKGAKKRNGWKHAIKWVSTNKKKDQIVRNDATLYEIQEKQRYLYYMGKNSEIQIINDYKDQNIYGIEINEKLLWEGYVNEHEECFRLKHFKKCAESCKCLKHVHDKNFFETLMEFMMDETIAQKHEALKWTEDGRKKEAPYSLVLVDRDKIVDVVLKSRYFDNVKFDEADDIIFNFETFMTLLRNAGFREETTGAGFARFYHELFQKDYPWKSVLIGSEHCTGRPSTFSWQEANLKSLRNKSKETKRKVVLWNQPDPSDRFSMCPYNLLMAYEENERVVPVVSDFDCFLVGTKRIKINNVPDEQLKMMENCLHRCEEILDRKGSDSFGNQWDMLGGKLSGVGWGDDKSKALMESAIDSLQQRDGCVRHSAECFNYFKPCDIDSEFLIIFEAGHKRKVRWQLHKEDELISYLSYQIDQGFTFPLNPKWVACDPQWRQLYEKLIQSDNPNIKMAQKVLYPHRVRERIKRISRKHEDGFIIRSASSGKLEAKAQYYILRQSSQSTKRLDEHTKLILQLGNIAQFKYTQGTWEKAAIVVAINEACSSKSGLRSVARACFDAGHPELVKQAEDPDVLPIVSSNKFGHVRCPTGDAKRIVPSKGKRFGTLQVKHVIFAVGPDFSTAQSETELLRKDEILKSAYKAALRQAIAAKVESIAFSLISSGNRIHESDPDRPLRLAISSICDFESLEKLKEIHIVLYTADDLSKMESIAGELSFELGIEKIQGGLREGLTSKNKYTSTRSGSVDFFDGTPKSEQLNYDLRRASIS